MCAEASQPAAKLPEDIADKLLIEEYKSCRDLIGKNIEIIERNEIYAVGAAAASAVFCLSSTDTTIVRATALIPFTVSILGLLRFIGIDRTIHKINNYLQSLEEKYEKIGWTKSYRSQNKHKFLKKTRYMIWGASVLVSAVFVGYMYCHGPVANSIANSGASQAQTATPAATRAAPMQKRNSN